MLLKVHPFALQTCCRLRCKDLDDRRRQLPSDYSPGAYFQDSVLSVLRRSSGEDTQGIYQNDYVDINVLPWCWPREMDGVRLLLVEILPQDAKNKNALYTYCPRLTAQQSEEWTGPEFILKLQGGHFTILKSKDKALGERCIDALLTHMRTLHDFDRLWDLRPEHPLCHLENVAPGIQVDAVRCLSAQELYDKVVLYHVGASGPRRHDVLFASLFKPKVFPRFFRVLEECDIDLPSAAGLSAHTAPVSDSATSTSIAITDEGFRKMGECYIVRNRAYQRERNFGDRAYSYQNLSKFLKSNKDKKNNDSKRAAENKFAAEAKSVIDNEDKSAADAKAAAEVKAAAEAKSSDEDKSAAEDKSASEAKSVEAQPNPQAQDEYSQELLALVLSLPQALSENYPQAAAADESQAVVAFSAVMASVLLTMPKLDRTDAFFSFCAWLLNHCTIPHQRTDPTSDQPSPHQCRAETILHNFASDPDNCENFEHMVSLVRFCHLLRFWHRDSNYSFAAKSQCIFELCYCSSHISMFNLCSEKDAARSLQECLKLINLEYLAPEARTPSPLTARWILLAAGRSVKQWGHHSSHEFERCEVEKESNFCEKWRHLIFSYAVMSLLYNEFNGNKLGPIGNYHFREKCKIGPVGSSSEKFVYASKATNDGTPYEASDYLGHNIVALAVCKRGSILRVSYNHNVLFSSTVDHAEERLIDGLFKDPSAFIEKSHAEIFKDGQRVNIEDHMKHISVYTSLEPCQQCSGKLHIAEVPELVFCQRDWVSFSEELK